MDSVALLLDHRHSMLKFVVVRVEDIYVREEEEQDDEEYFDDDHFVKETMDSEWMMKDHGLNNYFQVKIHRNDLIMELVNYCCALDSS